MYVNETYVKAFAEPSGIPSIIHAGQGHTLDKAIVSGVLSDFLRSSILPSYRPTPIGSDTGS